MNQPDFIIVGAGLAGSILAYTLVEHHHQKVLVIDNNYEKSASKIAAGLFNPITGKRMAKTWMADILFPFMHDFYTKAASSLNTSFLYNHLVYKPFDTMAEQNFWSAQAAESEYIDWVSVLTSFEDTIPRFQNTLGGLLLRHSGWLDCEAFLLAIKNYLSRHQMFETRIFHQDIANEIAPSAKVIFCEGYQAAFNPLWSWLRWRPSKGELIDIKINNAQPDGQSIINKSVFVCPSPESQIYRVGSTYSWGNLDQEPTADGKKELLHRLDSFFLDKYEMVGHRAGVRPTVQERKPYIGQHPIHHRYYIFNGFGSKSVSVAPYFASHFAEHLIYHKELSPLVNIQSYLNYFYQKI